MANEAKYNFKKLWYRLVDLEMTKQELADKADISVSSLSRLKKGIPLSYDRMSRICEAVGAKGFDEIMEKM